MRALVIRMPKSQRRTFRRHFPVWVGKASAGGRVAGFYARLGDRSLIVHRDMLVRESDRG